MYNDITISDNNMTTPVWNNSFILKPNLHTSMAEIANSRATLLM